jgi:hypothetical protein
MKPFSVRNVTRRRPSVRSASASLVIMGATLVIVVAMGWYETDTEPLALCLVAGGIMLCVFGLTFAKAVKAVPHKRVIRLAKLLLTLSFVIVTFVFAFSVFNAARSFQTCGDTKRNHVSSVGERSQIPSSFPLHLSTADPCFFAYMNVFWAAGCGLMLIAILRNQKVLRQVAPNFKSSDPGVPAQLSDP